MPVPYPKPQSNEQRIANAQYLRETGEQCPNKKWHEGDRNRITRVCFVCWARVIRSWEKV